MMASQPWSQLPWWRAVLSGMLVAVAYPEPGWWATSLVGYVPLIDWLLQDRRQPLHALALGWLAGLIQHLWVYAFLAHTMREMSGFPAVASLAVVFLHALAMGLHQGLWLGLAARWSPRSLWLQVAGIGLLLTAVEFAVPWLFPWYLASALFRTPLLMQPAEWLGVTLVSALQVGFGVLLVQAWQGRSWRRLGFAAAWLGLWVGYGLAAEYRVAAADVQAKSLHVTVVQHNPSLAEKRSRKSQERVVMLDKAESLTRGLPPRHRDLIIWAEGALPFYWTADPAGPPLPASQTRQRPDQRAQAERVRKLVAELGVPLLTGSLRHPDLLWQTRDHNAALLFHPNQPDPWIYDKKVLLAFGEYLPGSQLIPALRGAIPGVSDFAPGERSGLVEVAGVQLLVNICYEALFPAFLRDAGAAQADVLVNLTNDIWFGPQPAPDLHLMVQQARTIEFRRPLLRATTTGVTAHIAASGHFLQQTPVGQPAVVEMDVRVPPLTSPYAVWGDAPMWLLALLTLAAAWTRRGGTVMDTPQHATHNTRPQPNAAES